jgi:hypothetical protein
VLKTRRVHKRAAAALLIASLLIAGAVSACSDDPKPPPHDVPYNSLFDRFQAADFNVVYSAKTNGADAERSFTFTRQRGAQRWEMVSRYEEDGLYGGESVYSDAEGNGWSCTWQENAHNAARTVCYGYVWQSDLINSLVVGVLQPDASISAAGIESFAGLDGYCYDVLRLPYRGKVCLSGDGVPLYVRSKYQVGEGAVQLELRAESADPTAPTEALATPIADLGLVVGDHAAVGPTVVPTDNLKLITEKPQQPD